VLPCPGNVVLSGGITAVLDVHAKYTGEIANKIKMKKKKFNNQ
jgi:hypothetical protein